MILNLKFVCLKYEKLRQSVIQAAYSVPGVSKPTGELTDDMLVAAYKSTVDENVQMKEKIEELEESLKNNETYHTETIEGLTQLENFMIANEVILMENFVNKLVLNFFAFRRN